MLNIFFMFITLLSFFLVLMVLVVAHELGHYWAAKKFGIKTEEFGFGIPPRAFGLYRDKDGKKRWVWGGKETPEAVGTVVSFNYLPLGGFVKIKGEEAEGEDSTADADSFVSKKPWQRAVVLIAGVSMNFILAFILFTVGFKTGIPKSFVEYIFQEKIPVEIFVREILPDSPASKSSLLAGDQIIGINEQEFTAIEDLQKFVKDKEGQDLNYHIKRGVDGKTFDVKVRPAKIKNSSGEEQVGIGIALADSGLIKYSFFESVSRGAQATYKSVEMIFVELGKMLRKAIFGTGESTGELAGPIGIAIISGDAARMGLPYILQFMAILSINLAVINILPLPAVDGGKLLFVILEKIKGRPVDRKLENIIHYIGFMLFILLALIVTAGEIQKYAGDAIGHLWQVVKNVF